MRKCIIVLGMHRSGTSVYTGLLNLLGVHLGFDLLGPHVKQNPKGFFENNKIVMFNRDLMTAMETSWDAVDALPPDWFEEPRLDPFYQKAAAVIRQELGTFELTAVKDPRFCRLLPFWLRVFQELEIQLYFLITVRNPLEVALSLQERDGFSLHTGHLLWMSHMLEAEFHTRNYSRVFHRFDELIRSPRESLLSIINQFKKISLPDIEKKSSEIQDFTEPDLKHYTCEIPTVQNPVTRLIYQYYDLLIQPNLLSSQVDFVREQYEAVQACFYNQDLELNHFRKRRIKKKLTENDVKIKTQGGLIADKDRHITNLQQDLLKKDTHITNLQAGMDQTGKLAKFQQEEIKDKRKHIHHLETFLTGKDDHISNLNKKIKQLKLTINNKQTHIENLEENLTVQYNTVISELKACQQKEAETATATNCHIRNLEAELQNIKSSKVWRLACKGRQVFYEHMLGPFPILQKSALTMSTHGVKALADIFHHESTLFKYRPLISIIMPVYNVDVIWLKKAINSVLHQVYSKWELCIADDCSTRKNVKRTLKRMARKDQRIKIVYLPENRGIADASNAALELATGEYIGLLDNDDELTLDALFEVVKELNYCQADLIYSDEDKLSPDNQLVNPYFKSDWAPDTFRSYNYLCHFTVLRKALVDQVGGFSKNYDGSQDYDLFLKVGEVARQITHIPKVLYHWRMIKGSAAMDMGAKSYAHHNAKRALEEHLKRINLEGRVEDGLFLSSYRIRYRIHHNPGVTIIIPTKDKVEVLQRCLDSIFTTTTYKNYRILVVDNASTEPATRIYYQQLEQHPQVSILAYQQTFNFAAIINFAAAQIKTEYMLLLNNDTEVITPDWIETMLELGQRQDVGAVGALLYFPDDVIQHAGVILGIGRVAGHSHKYFKRGDPGYFGRPLVIQNLSAVTAACMLTSKVDFDAVCGFDETYTHAFNDVDYCLKLRAAGRLIVYTPFCELYHHESLSRGYEDTPEKQMRFQTEVEYFEKKWARVLQKPDPYYNPNLTLEREDFSIIKVV